MRAVSLSSASHRAAHGHCVYQDDVSAAD
ncbi:hypothetical protein, partial [Escherichia coli]